MGLSRPRRIALLIAVAVSAFGLLIAAGRSGGTDHPAHQAIVTGPAASKIPTPGSSAAKSSTTTTVTPLTPAPVRSASIVLAAYTRSGAAVSIPTVLWYPLEPGEESLPLVVFSPGYQIPPSAYSLLTTAWAAAGYLVAEPTYPDTAPGAPAIESDMVNHPGELEQVITGLVDDSARGYLPTRDVIDANRIAVAGQSDGGDVSLAAAANTCCRDPRIKAAVILSGAESALFGGGYFAAGGPALLAIQGTADTVNVPACSEQLYDAAPLPRYYLSLFGATHLSAYTAAGPQLSVVVAVTTAFLDGYVKSITSRVAQIPYLGTDAPVSQIIGGSGTVPLEGLCPGAP